MRSIKALTSARHALIFLLFRVGGFHLFWGMDDPLSHCGIFVGMVETLTSVEIILRYTHNARVAWIWTWGIALTGAFPFVLFMQRGYTVLVCFVWFGPCAMFLLAVASGLGNGSRLSIITIGSLHPHRILFNPIRAYILAYISNGFLYRYDLSPFKFCLSNL